MSSMGRRGSIPRCPTGRAATGVVELGLTEHWLLGLCQPRLKSWKNASTMYHLNIRLMC